MISHRRRRRRAPAHEIIFVNGSGAGERRVVVSRGADGAGGFGFTIAGQRPCVVSCVAAVGGAERAGLRAGDMLLAVEATNVTRAEHEMVARMIAAAPAHITLTVASPDDHSDTSEEERTRQPLRYRHPGRPHTRAPRRRPQCVATPTPITYGSRPSFVSEAYEPAKAAHVRETSSKNILQLIGPRAVSPYKEGGRGQLECRVLVGYLGTVESPHALAPDAELAAVRHAVRRLRHERRALAAATVLFVVTPTALALRRAGPAAPPLACYPRDRLRGVYAARPDDAHVNSDARHFALLTRSPPPGIATGCHVFVVDESSVEHRAHAETARRFGVACTLDPISGHCLEFPGSAAYVVDLVRCMYSLPAPLTGSASALAPAPAPRSPQPSNHSEPTTGSSNSDSGIGFHNECTDVAERILVVEFGHPPSAHYDPVYTDSEGHHYETIGPKPRPRTGFAAGVLRRVQASLDDMLLVREDTFLHPAAVGARAPRRGPRPSASAGDVCASCSNADSEGAAPGALLNASSAPDLRPLAERVSHFRRWTTTATAAAAAAGGECNAVAAGACAGPRGDGASGGGGGRVARWSLGLEHLLADEAGAGAFAAFLAKEFAAENIRFWSACERYAAAGANERARAAAALWERHLADGAPEPVNVDAGARRAADPQHAARPPPTDLFRSAQNQIFNLMKFDSYPRFLRSPLHAECARADLRGLPLPHEPAPAPCPPAHAGTQDHAKLKKSASNASERRRSGGSLLPWARLRAASRDRDSDSRAPSPSVGGAAGPAVVGCSLCRLVLPDGATSVVGVEASVSVRALVDRLLARRALPAAAYDVLVAGAAGEPPAPVDVDAPSTVLGGRQATVERRCVFRLELGGRRAVGVRCRPGKRLRHVLRPVLAKYAPAAAAEPAVLCDGRLLPLDTRVQEVDGARLQLAGIGEHAHTPASAPAPAPAPAPPRTPEHDDEREPLSVRAALRPAPAPLAAPPLPPKPRPPPPAPS